jgi:hypothetical protein
MESSVAKTKREQPRGWRQWKPEEAKKHLAEWQGSGLALEKFAQQRGLSAKRLRWWRRRLGEWSPEKPKHERSALVPVVVTATVPPAVAKQSHAAVVVVHVPGGAVVEVVEPQAVGAEWLAAVVGQLTRCGG